MEQGQRSKPPTYQCGNKEGFWENRLLAQEYSNRPTMLPTVLQYPFFTGTRFESLRKLNQATDSSLNHEKATQSPFQGMTSPSTDHAPIRMLYGSCQLLFLTETARNSVVPGQVRNENLCTEYGSEARIPRRHE